MARYSSFLGLHVEVQYRAGDILLPASGTFVGDTGRSIFMEQNFEVRGQRKHFRWEIPYQYIVRLAEKTNPAASPLEGKPEARSTPSVETTEESTSSEEPENAASAIAGFSSNAAVIFPRPQRSNI